MARKVFISVLGTGYYQPCVYGTTNVKTRFIQVATLLNINAQEWCDNDAGIVLLTDKARITNWEVAGNKRMNPRNKLEEDYQGLKQSIDELKLPFEVDAIQIPDGKDKDEMWVIFAALYNALQDGDELYIDLTHAFRYLPMLVLVLTNYAKFLKGVTVKSLTYGNYEALDGGIAPILDLLPIAALQDWTIAAADYMNNGYSKLIKDLAVDALTPLLRVPGHDRNHDKTRGFTVALEKLSNERILCRGMDITSAKSINKLIAAINQIETITVAPLKPIMDKLAASAHTQGNSDIERCIEAARWCYDKHLYQQAVTILQEGIVTFLCGRHGIPIDDREKRALVNIAFMVMAQSHEEVLSLNQFAQDNKPVLDAIASDEYLSNEELVNLFAAITNLRNDYNHSGFREFPRDADKMMKCIHDYIETASRIFL